MELLTKKLTDTIPELYSQDDKNDPTVHVKYFSPVSPATWLVTEASVVRDGEHLPLTDYREGDEVLMFGYARILRGCGELGYTAFSQIRDYSGPLGLGIERDLHFEPCPLSEAKAQNNL